jgi:hypothetical protein
LLFVIYNKYLNPRFLYKSISWIFKISVQNILFLLKNRL